MTLKSMLAKALGVRALEFKALNQRMDVLEELLNEEDPRSSIQELDSDEALEELSAIAATLQSAYDQAVSGKVVQLY